MSRIKELPVLLARFPSEEVGEGAAFNCSAADHWINVFFFFCFVSYSLQKESVEYK